MARHTWLGQGILMVVLVVATPGSPALAAPAARAPDVKKSAPPDPKAVAAMNAAAAELVKEAQAAFKEPNPKLRDKSDYFIEKPNPDITPEIVLMGLERSQNGDPRIDAYVKWQLLSGLAAAFPEELVPRAIAAYRKAPEPYNHPGMEHAKLASALYRVGMMKKDRMDDVNKGFAEVLDKNANENFYILRYRKDLYGRLPVSADSLMAGLDDIFTRVRHGVNASEFWETLAGSLQSWALSADPRQRDAVMQSLDKLQKMVKDINFRPYMRVVWNDDAKNAGMHWQDQAVVEDSKIKALVDGIRESGKLMEGAGFKDQPKK